MIKVEKTREQKIIENYFGKEATPITKREFKIEGAGYYQVHPISYIESHPEFNKLSVDAIKVDEFYLIRYK
ncbi:hypothetical protein Q0590_26475 [Rhodocytophaga aerolata]|uniref:Uncharacterized protein n=1 Tax=Rhodocytophaga aerolata TaxID=455078 RepID=A0ABT8RCM1_9BACT|nr:hypothetical protein [Rhodocytophaga aerolata]MDO1449853.1 hypothetical protein [Rhodocytophaga aerolata]